MLRIAPCDKGLRTTRRSGLVRLLRTGTLSSNEDHTLRHINPAIVRSGWGSEASMTQRDLTCVQDVNNKIFTFPEVKVFCSRTGYEPVECAAAGILQHCCAWEAITASGRWWIVIIFVMECPSVWTTCRQAAPRFTQVTLWSRNWGWKLRVLLRTNDN